MGSQEMSSLAFCGGGMLKLAVGHMFGPLLEWNMWEYVRVGPVLYFMKVLGS